MDCFVALLLATAMTTNIDLILLAAFLSRTLNASALLCQLDSSHIRTMAKNPKNPKKPVKTPKSKAHRPDVQPIGPALAELLNPAINRGDAGLGSGTGLRPPPDNSKDRRAGGEAAVHRARASTRGASDDVAKPDTRAKRDDASFS